MMERNPNRKFWFAVIVLAIVAIASLVATVWTLNELNGARDSLLLVDDDLEELQDELATVEIALNASKGIVESVEDTLSSLQVNYDRLTTGYGYVSRDPSYQEMKDFLKQDETNEQEYSGSEYVCVDFAADVKANATKEGIRCAFVAIEYIGRIGHTIVASNTTDRGLVYIEPQYDWEVEPEIGQSYYQCVKPPPGYYMDAPAYDDTIARFIVIW